MTFKLISDHIIITIMESFPSTGWGVLNVIQFYRNISLTNASVVCPVLPFLDTVEVLCSGETKRLCSYVENVRPDSRGRCCRRI